MANDLYKQSGNDPRGRVQNRVREGIGRSRARNEPLQKEMAKNYTRGTRTNMADYGDIMNRYRDVAGGGGQRGERISYNDPFKSYGGYEDFSKTGGYSGQDLANIRARGVSPIRAVYANANRDVNRQRSLQGGYSPNFTAAKAKMAREQAFSTADAVQGVEAGLSEAVQKGKLAGLGGMSNIEGQRLGADLDVGKFNAMQGNQDRLNQLNALQGMTSLYGTTPGMAQLFGNQALDAGQQASQDELAWTDREQNAQNLPGRYEQTKEYIGDAVNAVSPWLESITDYFKNRNKPKTPSYTQGQTGIPTRNSGSKSLWGNVRF